MFLAHLYCKKIPHGNQILPLFCLGQINSYFSSSSVCNSGTSLLFLDEHISGKIHLLGHETKILASPAFVTFGV